MMSRNSSLLACRSLLVLGGARSGKSAYAQRLAEQSGKAAYFIATGEAHDSEMQDRIARHRQARGAQWGLSEQPLELVAALSREAAGGRVLLVDCATLWLANLMFAQRDLELETGNLAALLPTLPGSIILVSNEVGQGIVPDNAMARRFRDAQGRLNQSLAAVCDCVVEVTAGLPQLLKPVAEFNLRF